MQCHHFLALLIGIGLCACLGGPFYAAEQDGEAGITGKPPGATERTEDLVEELEHAFADQGSDYVPRTEHKNSDGDPRFINRLILENSPYLLQHAHNPVDWHSWGDDAFELARKLGRPVFLSVGYATCHWCHVMEVESFENLEIAEFINTHYVAIKLDRERRPDVDSIYMAAVQSMTGRGGWPMTVFMTPDREPFFGGTYFPPRDGMRGGRRPGFLTILKRYAEKYEQSPEDVHRDAAELSRKLRANANQLTSGKIPAASSFQRLRNYYDRQFDQRYGGFGRAPKFPRPVTLDFLMRYHRRTGDGQALHMVTHTLDKMADGGIYDDVGGGFHRYATDPRWLTPHFEKMLYDNALLVRSYLDAYQITGAHKAERIVRETLDYVAKEMTTPGGGFFSATDADSLAPTGHMEEGWFFTWTLDEMKQVLDDEELAVLRFHHGVTKRGNFEGRTILEVKRTREDTAKKFSLTPEKLVSIFESAYAKLYLVRAKRPWPLRDDKVIAAWNGLMISSMARASMVLNDEKYLVAATRAANFVQETLIQNDVLLRVTRDGLTSHPGTLDDYAFLIAGLLDLFEAGQDLRWIALALRLQDRLDSSFWDSKKGGYFFAAKEIKGLLHREKPAYDGAIPAGTSIETENLLRFYEYTSDTKYQEKAFTSLKLFATPIKQGRMPRLACALDFYLDRPLEIVLIKPNAQADASAFLDILAKSYLPNRILVVAVEGVEVEKVGKLIPLVAGKTSIDGKVTAYVCEEGICELPTTDPEKFRGQIDKKTPYPTSPSSE